MIKIIKSTNEHSKCLNEIFEESIPFFIQVEGRKPLEPLTCIRGKIGNPPPSIKTMCFTIFFNDEIAGYTWILEEKIKYYYILHFYIKDSFKRKSIGRETIKALDKIYRKKGIKTCQLQVSGSNYIGLKFWTNIGFNKIIYVEAPEENSLTSSVELELERSF